jgi:endonuclease YncB( thermonuclease family)
MAGLCTKVTAKSYGQVKVDRVVGVYDGDTVTVSIKGWPPLIGESVSVRIAGIDTPEIRGQCAGEKALAMQARTLTRQLLSSARSVELRNLQRDKYFRILADICIDGQDLGDILIQRRLALPYTGGTKSSWCGPLRR